MSIAALSPHEQNVVQNIIDRIAFFGTQEMQTDDGLTWIARLLKLAPNGFHLSVKELEQIAQTHDTDDLIKLDNGSDIVGDMSLHFEWLDDFLPTLNMWIHIAESILRSTDSGDTFKADPKFAEQRSELNRLLTDVLGAYPPAILEGPGYRDQYDNWPMRNSHELLRRYWVYTRYICAFAKERWPRVKMDKLLQQP